jgi:hypothetical protein
VQSSPGAFQQAHCGTLFLDEIAELRPAAQVALLRVLETRCIQPIGASSDREVDVRIIAASHQDLGHYVAEGRFRADLFYRLTESAAGKARSPKRTPHALRGPGTGFASRRPGGGASRSPPPSRPQATLTEVCRAGTVLAGASLVDRT